jgi:hypothetical protein
MGTAQASPGVPALNVGPGASDHPTLKAWLSRSGGAYDLATFKKLEGQPNWTMEWNTDDQLAKAAFERIVRSVQTQIELN